MHIVLDQSEYRTCWIFEMNRLIWGKLAGVVIGQWNYWRNCFLLFVFGLIYGIIRKRDKYRSNQMWYIRSILCFMCECVCVLYWYISWSRWQFLTQMEFQQTLVFFFRVVFSKMFWSLQILVSFRGMIKSKIENSWIVLNN